VLVTSAVGLVAALTLSACSGGGPSPTVTTPVATSSTGSTTVGTATTTSTASTTAAPVFPVGLPAAAKVRDAKGAEAFVRHFMSQLNASWVRPDPELLDPLCQSKTSKSCTAYRETAAELSAKGHHYAGAPATTTKVTALVALDGHQRVDFQGIQEQRSVVDSSGRVVLTDSRKQLHWMFFLDWGSTGWIVYDVKLVRF
jgi:hypothetical protein